jgi:hypothetical protein
LRMSWKKPAKTVIAKRKAIMMLGIKSPSRGMPPIGAGKDVELDISRVELKSGGETEKSLKEG